MKCAHQDRIIVQNTRTANLFINICLWKKHKNTCFRKKKLYCRVLVNEGLSHLCLFGNKLAFTHILSVSAPFLCALEICNLSVHTLWRTFYQQCWNYMVHLCEKDIFSKVCKILIVNWTFFFYCLNINHSWDCLSSRTNESVPIWQQIVAPGAC